MSAVASPASRRARDLGSSAAAGWGLRLSEAGLKGSRDVRQTR